MQYRSLSRLIVRQIDASNVQDYQKVLDMRASLMKDIKQNREQFNSGDQDCEVYLLEQAEGKPLATMRVIPNPEGFQFSKLSVDSTFQRQGLGRYLMQRLIERYHPKLGQRQAIFGDSKLELVDYYATFGFKAVGPPFKKWGADYTRIVYDPARHQ